jgi:hypothetical protein
MNRQWAGIQHLLKQIRREIDVAAQFIKDVFEKQDAGTCNPEQVARELGLPKLGLPKLGLEER